MKQCDITGIACEGLEGIKIPAFGMAWVSPAVKLLLIEGKTVSEIRDLYKEFDKKINLMSADERKEFFADSVHIRL